MIIDFENSNKGKIKMIVMSFSNAGNFISLQNPQKPDLKTRWVSFVSKW